MLKGRGGEQEVADGQTLEPQVWEGEDEHGSVAFRDSVEAGLEVGGYAFLEGGGVSRSVEVSWEFVRVEVI